VLRSIRCIPVTGDPGRSKGSPLAIVRKGGVASGGRSAPVVDDHSVPRIRDNLEPILQRLKDRRIAWSDFAGTQGAVGTVRTDGVRQIFLRDPDGYWIEVNDALKNTTK
jgi:catechol 2,3-dioxygenase-like lactoylglutathione lyase family enzyme